MQESELLRWYVDMGVDSAIDESPHDRFSESAVAPVPVAPAARPVAPVSPQPDTRPATPPAAATTAESAVAARVAAARATTLGELRAELDSFEGCGLRRTATQLVFGDGAAKARVMFIGEAPGRDEDLQGVPFVGRSGQLLDRMLDAIGLDRQAVYIANIVPWRPPGNRTPTPQETAACRPFIDRQIELVAPQCLVCLGGAAAKELLATTEGILRLRGQWRTFTTGGLDIPAIATLHPAYLLRQPAQKKLAWRDMLAVKEALDTPAAKA
ncbi:MAG: uracil-DNA glycosylase [Alphaproteobacteria bacterium]